MSDKKTGNYPTTDHELLSAFEGGVNPVNDTALFMALGGQDIFDKEGFPTDVKEKVRKLRREMLAGRDTGEVREYLDGEFQNDLAEICDGLADIVVVAIGTLIRYVGLRTAQRIFWEVGQSNLAKVDGRFGAIRWIGQKGGKIGKPEGWLPPNIADILDANPKLKGWREWRSMESFTVESKDGKGDGPSNKFRPVKDNPQV